MFFSAFGRLLCPRFLLFIICSVWFGCHFNSFHYPYLMPNDHLWPGSTDVYLRAFNFATNGQRNVAKYNSTSHGNQPRNGRQGRLRETIDMHGKHGAYNNKKRTLPAAASRTRFIIYIYESYWTLCISSDRTKTKKKKKIKETTISDCVSHIDRMAWPASVCVCV